MQSKKNFLKVMKLVLFINYLAQKNNYAFLLKEQRKKEEYYYKIFLISRY